MDAACDDENVMTAFVGLSSQTGEPCSRWSTWRPSWKSSAAPKPQVRRAQGHTRLHGSRWRSSVKPRNLDMLSMHVALILRACARRPDNRLCTGSRAAHARPEHPW